MTQRERLVAAFYGTLVGALLGFWLAILLVLIVPAANFAGLVIPTVIALTSVCGLSVGYCFGQRPIEVVTWIIDLLP